MSIFLHKIQDRRSFFRHAGKTCAELDSVSIARRNKFYPVSPMALLRSYFAKKI